MSTMWAGIDSGKRAHHCVVINSSGVVLLSRRGLMPSQLADGQRGMQDVVRLRRCPRAGASVSRRRLWTGLLQTPFVPDWPGQDTYAGSLIPAAGYAAFRRRRAVSG